VPHGTRALRPIPPNKTSDNSRWRFFREREAELLNRIGGAAPDERQALAMRMIIESEWDMRAAQIDADNATNSKYRYNSLKLAADMRKAVLLWNRELNVATACRSAAAAGEPQQPNLADVLADIARRRSEPEDEDGDDEAACDHQPARDACVSSPASLSHGGRGRPRLSLPSARSCGVRLFPRPPLGATGRRRATPRRFPAVTHVFHAVTGAP
jgi:hypothetical protein